MPVTRPQGVLTDGFPTLFGFGSGPEDPFDETMGITMCEKRLKPFGMDGGGPNDTTCMRNTRWRTRQGKKLLTLTEMSITVSYNPVVFEDMVDVLQRNNPMYFAWPDGSLVTFWGFVESFDPHEITEGAQPEADLKVCPTNQNLAGEEEPPFYDSAGWTPQAFDFGD